jgi:putative colanic acid biosynthesis acetyltransferase WcaF
MSKYYNKKELLLRLLWSVVELLFFRFSPRLFYGWRNFVLRTMGAKIGKGVQVFPSVRIMFPWNLEVGDRSVLSWDVKVYNLGKIAIGKNTVISQYSHLCGATHDYQSQTFTLFAPGLTIGDNVWIAADAFIGPGVKVNNGAVVAARAVVVKDVLSLTVVAGNPARPVKEIEAVPPMLYPR